MPNLFQAVYCHRLIPPFSGCCNLAHAKGSLKPCRPTFQAAHIPAHTAVNKINPPISQRQPEKPAQSS
nr:hypothetical protein [uncultured Kingella sp.]